MIIGPQWQPGSWWFWEFGSSNRRPAFGLGHWWVVLPVLPVLVSCNMKWADRAQCSCLVGPQCRGSPHF